MIFPECDIARVMQRALDMPMVSDCDSCVACRAIKTSQIVCHLRGAASEAGLGTSMQDLTGDADDTLDQVLPFGVGNCVGRAEYVNGPGLTPIACFGDGRVTAGWMLRGARTFDIIHQRRLIVLQLDNRLRLGLSYNLEGFFGSASHRG